MSTRQAIIATLQAHPTATFTWIGEQHGVSREYARQVAVSIGDTGSQRSRARKDDRDMRSKQAKVARGFPTAGRYSFTALVRRWLAVIDHSYCCMCHGVKPVDEFTASQNRSLTAQRCKACAAEWHRQYYSTERGKEYMRQYVRTEQYRAYQRASYHQRKAQQQKSPTVA